jgi:multimeric flavodoxin WrbA
MTQARPLRALMLVCTLSPSPKSSSSQLLGQQLLDAMATHGVESSTVRVVDHDVKPGVEIDMGPGDEWPEIRAQVLAADILVIATPTWMGQLSSVGQRVLERLDAELSETNEQGLPILYGKVAVAAIVGNEDGAHHITATLFQALNDVGFSIPAQGAVYWNGEAMHGTDYQDLPEAPEQVASQTRTVAANAVHLARALAPAPYPAP